MRWSPVVAVSFTISSLVLALVFAQTAPPIPAAAQAAFGELRKEPFRAHMAFLADDLLEGRGTGVRGHEIAARYVAAQFEALGLKPAGENGSYYQQVPLREDTIEPEQCALSITANGSSTQLKLGDDFLIDGRVVASTDASVEAPVVFAGYGVTTPDGRYDDYAGVDVKGKIVALLLGTPPSLPSELGAHLGEFHEKLRSARDHGAVGVITLRSPKSEKLFPWPQAIVMLNTAMKWLGPDGVPNGSYTDIQAVAALSVANSERLFQGAAKSWADVLSDADASKPQAFPLPVSARLRVVSHHKAITSPNVAAVLPGSDPKLREEYVVYTAHVDHLGIGKPVNGDAIYNGAGDDASGVAALLVIAKAFKSLAHPPARSILFLGVTAEESGMLGSDYFAHFPTVPIRSIVSDINMDGASIHYAFKNIVALGAPDSTLESVVERNAALLRLKVSPDRRPEEQLFRRSDQYSFVRQGVPSVFIYAGGEAKDPKFNVREFNQKWRVYHTPFDDMNQPMDLNAAVQFMQLEFLVGYDIANDPQRPTWKPGDFFGETFGRK